MNKIELVFYKTDFLYFQPFYPILKYKVYGDEYQQDLFQKVILDIKGNAFHLLAKSISSDWFKSINEEGLYKIRIYYTYNTVLNMFMINNIDVTDIEYLGDINDKVRCNYKR